MSLVLLLVVLVVLAGVGGAVALAVSGRRQYAAQNEIIPGQPSEAPASWAGAHTPEAKLHRRLGAMVRGLRDAADHGHEGIDALERRVELEQAALDLDRQLIAAAARGDGGRTAAIAAIGEQVAELETLAAAHAAGVSGGPTAEGLRRDIGEDVAEAVTEQHRPDEPGAQSGGRA